MKNKIIYLSIFLSGAIIYLIYKNKNNNNDNNNLNNEVEDLLEYNKNKINDAFNPKAYTDIFKKTKYKNIDDYFKENNIEKYKLSNYVINIYNSKGLVNDDEDKIYSIFDELNSIFIISLISYLFEKQYKTSLITYLSSFLNKDELNKVYSIISNKKYI